MMLFLQHCEGFSGSYGMYIARFDPRSKLYQYQLTHCSNDYDSDGDKKEFLIE